MTQFLSISFLFIIGLLTILLAVIISKQRGNQQWTSSIIAMLLCQSIWTFGYGIELWVPTLDMKLLAAKVQYIGITAVSYFWLIFAIKFAGYNNWLTRRRLIFLSIIPVVTLLLATTNEWHRLIWANISLDTSGPLVIMAITHGPLFWAYSVVAQAYVITGSILMFIHLRQIHTQHHWQVRLLAILPMVPLLGNVAYILDFVPIPGLDLTPYTFAISSVLISWGIYRLEMFDISPIARQTAVYNIKDGLVVVDLKQRIIDVNPATQKILNRKPDELIGKPVSEIAKIAPALSDLHNQVLQGDGKTVFGMRHNGRFYDINISKIRDRRKNNHGWIVAFRDISKRKQAEEALARQKLTFEGVAKIVKALAEGIDPTARFKNALQAAANLVQAQSSSLLLLNQQSEITHIFSTSKLQSEPELTFEPLPPHVSQLVTKIIQQRQRLIIDVTRSNIFWPTQPNMPPIASVLAIPILHSQQLIGIMLFEHTQFRFFKPQIANMIQSAADQIALALENARIYEKEVRLAAQQKALYLVLRQLNLHLDTKTMMKNTIATIQQQTGWSAVHILVPTIDESSFTIAATTRAKAKQANKFAPSKHHAALIQKAYATGHLQKTTKPTLPIKPGSCQFQSMLALPLVYQQQKLGVFVVHEEKPAVFSQEELLLAESLAEACALALNNTRLHNQTKRQLQEQTVIRQAISAITSTLDLTILLEQLAQQISEVVPLTRVIIYKYDSETKKSTLLAKYISTTATPEERTRCEGNHQYINTKHFTDKLKTPQVIHIPKEKNQNNHIITLPIHIARKTIAFAELCNSQSNRPFTNEETGLVRTIVQQAAIAIENANLFQSVKEQQGHLSALIQSSNDGIVLVGMDQRLLVVNETAVKFLRQKKQPEHWNNLPLPLLLNQVSQGHPDDWEQMQMIPSARQILDGQIELGDRILRWQNHLIAIEKEPIGHLLLLRDVTDEIMVERMREELTSTMVHDLRNPISATMLTLDILAKFSKDELSEKSISLITRATHTTRKTLNLVNQILDISQLESGKMPIQYETFDLAQLVTDVFDLQESIAKAKDIILEINLPSSMPQIWADKGLIERVLQNLIGNAVKFTPAGGKVQVAAQFTPPADALQVTITDNGPGIPKSLQPHLFQKFVTGDQHESGSGLGLAFCKMVAENHNQTLKIAETSPNGTTFLLTLPIHQPEPISSHS